MFLPATKTKTGRDRFVPISARLRMILEMRAAEQRVNLELKDDQELPAGGYVFGNQLSEPRGFSKRLWERAVLQAHGYPARYEKRALAPAMAPPGTVPRKRRPTPVLTRECRKQLASIGLHFHDLRREAGSRWLEGGVPLHTVQEWLGHTNIAQTSTYLRTSSQGHDDAMRKFDERRGLLSDCKPAATATRSDVANTLEKGDRAGSDLTGNRVKPDENIGDDAPKETENHGVGSSILPLATSSISS